MTLVNGLMVLTIQYIFYSIVVIEIPTSRLELKFKEIKNETIEFSVHSKLMNSFNGLNFGGMDFFLYCLRLDRSIS